MSTPGTSTTSRGTDVALSASRPPTLYSRASSSRQNPHAEPGATASTTTASCPPRKRQRRGSLKSTRTGITSKSTRTGRPRRKSRAISVLGANSDDIICALSEARGVSPAIGVALVNLSTDEAFLSQISDNHFFVKTFNKISLLEPSEILIVASSMPPNPESNFHNLLEQKFPDIPIKPCDRDYWSEEKGSKLIEALAFCEDVHAVKVAIEGKFYAVSSFAAVMRHLEVENSMKFTDHTMRIRYLPSEETMMIDLSTFQSLELLRNVQDEKSKDCLFGLLDQTLTPMGSRLLRSNILQPSTQVEQVLEPRYAAVEELTKDETMFFHVRKALRGFVDVEKLIPGLSIVRTNEPHYQTEQDINFVLAVKKFLLAVGPVAEALGSARSSLLTTARVYCRQEIREPIIEMIKKVIKDDVEHATSPLELRNQRGNAVKDDISGLLHVARRTSEQVTDEVFKHVEDVKTEHSLSAEVRYDKVRQYYLRLTRSEFDDRDIPEEFVNVVQKKKYIECQTLTLIKYNEHLATAVDEATELSGKVVEDLVESLRFYVSSMFQMCEAIALVDMLASFSYVATAHNYCRPTISGDFLALKDARHPLLETSRTFIPNDYYTSQDCRFMIITGSNMSGKSTFVKTIALLQIMVQVGSFVPAEYASFPIFESLLCRVAKEDVIETNLSTFSTEMREMAFILRNINNRSLTIIDEIGRGTSNREGLAIAMALADTILQSGSTVFFATHFIELAEAMDHQPGVTNLHLKSEMAVEEEQSKITMLYKTGEGPVQNVNYGIDLARTMCFPQSFIETAQHVSDTLRNKAEAKRRESIYRTTEKRRQLVHGAYEMLRRVRQLDLPANELEAFLARAQTKFIREMDRLYQKGSEDGSAGVPHARSEESGSTEPGAIPEPGTIHDDSEDPDTVMTDEGETIIEEEETGAGSFQDESSSAATERMDEMDEDDVFG